MGQQQLLLLVLGIVIVGLAVVVGIQAFSENQKKANADALVNDAIRIASDAQAWKLKPAAFGGGASASNWTGLTFAQLGYETGDNSSTSATAEDDQYENLNGVYDLAASGQVPCSRAMGKLLFPRREIEAWLARESSGGGEAKALRRPRFQAITPKTNSRYPETR